jgi:two-component system, probable response regulator PhcQ
MPRIMLVDDEPNVLNSLRRAIHAMPGHLFGGQVTVEAFDDPTAALERAGECAFDLVISDFRMPDLDGIQFLTRLIAIQPQIARIMLSGYADLRALVSAINEVQVFRFVAKPWNNFDLGASMAQALEQRHILQENQRLADLVRLLEGRISEEELELQRWEQACPVLTQVDRNDDGSVSLEWEDDSAIPAQPRQRTSVETQKRA